MGKPNKSTSPNSNTTNNKTTQTRFEEIEIVEAPITMSTSYLSSIEKLKGRENYSSWKFSMENYLALEDLSKCILGTETDEKKNAKAKAALNLSIDKINFVHVKSAKTAKEIWTNLQTTFEDKGAVRKVTLMRKIANTKLENCESMDVYVSEIISTAQKLTDLGFDVPDEWLAVFLLSGLSDEFLPMIMAIESSDKALSSDSVKTKLLQESTSTTASDEKAFFAKNRNSFRKNGGIICYKCKQKGHKSFNCPENATKSNDKRPSNFDKNTKKPTAFSAVFLSGKFNKDDWYCDSGATQHMSMRDDWIAGETKYGMPSIRAANDDEMEVKCSGLVNFDADVNGEISKIEFHDVLCVPKLTANLLSVSEITKKDKSVLFTSRGCVIRDSNGELLATGTMVDGLYRLDGKHDMAMAAIGSSKSMELWHRRLGHVNPSYLKKMRNGGVVGVDYAGDEHSIECIACCKGKQTRKPFPKHGSRAKELLETIHGDLLGKVECSSIGGSKFCLVLVDDFSRRTFVFMLKRSIQQILLIQKAC